MARRIDLNADLGEGCGQDAALIEVLTSANICCGLHAGSAAEMARTMRLARDAGLGIGAHPGFDDRANFGRTRCQLSADDLREPGILPTALAQIGIQIDPARHSSSSSPRIAPPIS